MSFDSKKEKHPSAPAIKKYLPPELQSIEIEVFDSLDSTNTRAKRGSYPIGSVLVAKEQTGGRGRLGKSFFSPADSGIYLSVVIKPSKTNIEEITAVAGLAVIRAIENVTGIKTEKRRINDIYLNNKKVGGILAEGITNIETTEIVAVVMGVGLNIFPPAAGFPKELEDIAGALLPFYTDEIDLNKIAAELIHSLLFLT